MHISELAKILKSSGSHEITSGLVLHVVEGGRITKLLTNTGERLRSFSTGVDPKDVRKAVNKSAGVEVITK